jgi:hypothetical protein
MPLLSFLRLLASLFARLFAYRFVLALANSHFTTLRFTCSHPHVAHLHLLFPQARAGEGDHRIWDMKPKHLFSGKRGIGKTDRR